MVYCDIFIELRAISIECEICGRNATAKARIEGAILNVCPTCLRFGSEVRISSERKIIPKQKDIIEDAINPDFSVIIKERRESLRLTREQLAKRINEKVSVIERVEHGMKPNTKLRKKLESALKIDLSYEEEKVRLAPQKSEEYTLGDAAQIRMRKKKV